MNTASKYHLSVLIIGLLFWLWIAGSCSPQKTHAPLPLEEVIGLAETGDLAAANTRLAQLQAMPHNHADSMRINVLQFMLKYKAYKDVRHDSYIIKAWQYFTQDTQEPLFRSLAGFYAACYYKETGQNNNKAIDYFKQALKTYQQQGDKPKRTKVYQNLGYAYLALEKFDSALFYYHTALAMAQNTQQTETCAKVLNGIGVAYGYRGDWPQKINYLRQALALQQDSVARMRSYINMAKTFVQMQAYDSAAHYLGHAKALFPACQDAYLAAYVYKVQTRLDLARQQYARVPASFAAYSRVYDSIARSISFKEHQQIAADFDKQLMQAQLLTARQKTMFYTYTLWVGIAVFLLLLTLLYIWWRKNQELKKAKQALEISERKAKALAAAQEAVAQQAKDAAQQAKYTAKDKSQEAQLARLHLEKQEAALLAAQKTAERETEAAKVKMQEATAKMETTQALQAALDKARIPIEESIFLKAVYAQYVTLSTQWLHQQLALEQKAINSKTKAEVLKDIANTTNMLKQQYHSFVDNTLIPATQYLNTQDIQLPQDLKSDYVFLIALLHTSLPLIQIKEILQIASKDAWRARLRRIKTKLETEGMPNTWIEKYLKTDSWDI